MLETLPRAPEAVIFDMDGLLFDTEPLYIRSLITAAHKHGYTMTDALYRPMLGCPWHVIRNLLLELFGRSFPVDQVRSDWLTEYNRLVDESLSVKVGALELLDLIDALGLPRAIATSSFRPSAVRYLFLHNLSDRFDYIVAHGDYDRSKPAPDPYIVAAKKLGVNPSACLALEDSHNGVRSAWSAGMMTIMVPDLLPPTHEIRELCVAIAPDLHVVGNILKSAQKAK